MFCANISVERKGNNLCVECLGQIDLTETILPAGQSTTNVLTVVTGTWTLITSREPFVLVVDFSTANVLVKTIVIL